MNSMHRLAPLPPPCCGTRLGDGIGGFGWCFLVWRDGGWLIMVGKGAAEVYGCVGRCVDV